MLGYAQPLNTKRVKFWTQAALNAAKQRNEIYTHLCQFLAAWDGKAINKRLREAIYADPWYEANGYRVSYLQYEYTDYIEVNMRSTHPHAEDINPSSVPGYCYRDSNRWDELHKYSFTATRKHTQDDDDNGRFSLANFQRRNADHLPNVDTLAEVLRNAEHYTNDWNKHLAELSSIHNTVSNASYLLGMLFDVSKDW